MNKNTMLSLVRELLAEELYELGQALDQFESGYTSLCPAAYREAARTSSRILARYPRCEVLMEAIALSPSLLALRGNLALEKAIQIGLWELPEEVLSCLTLEPPFRSRLSPRTK